MALTPDLVESTRRTVRLLVGARLEPTRWTVVESELDRLGTEVRAGDATAVTESVGRIAPLAFEGTVHRRLGSRRGSAPAVIPTKRSSALPVVGAVCAAVILALGWALGGGLMLAGTAAFALFILGVALAGTRAVAERTRRVRDTRAAPGDDVVEPPASVLGLLGEVERDLDAAG